MKIWAQLVIEVVRYKWKKKHPGYTKLYAFNNNKLSHTFRLAHSCFLIFPEEGFIGFFCFLLQYRWCHDKTHKLNSSQQHNKARRIPRLKTPLFCFNTDLGPVYFLTEISKLIAKLKLCYFKNFSNMITCRYSSYHPLVISKNTL